MKKKIATVGIIGLLATTNVITGFNYKQDIEKFTQELHKRNDKIDYLQKQIESKDQKIDLQRFKLDKLDKIIKVKDNEINSLKQELDKVKKENEEKKQRQVLDMEVTAYQPFCTEGCTGLTRSGYSVANTVYYEGMRIVAADLKVLPMYSIIQIDLQSGNSFKAIVLDSGGAINGRILDFLVPDQQTAIDFGRQQAKVSVIRYGKGE